MVQPDPAFPETVAADPLPCLMGACRAALTEMQCQVVDGVLKLITLAVKRYFPRHPMLALELCPGDSQAWCVLCQATFDPFESEIFLVDREEGGDRESPPPFDLLIPRRVPLTEFEFAVHLARKRDEWRVNVLILGCIVGLGVLRVDERVELDMPMLQEAEVRRLQTLLALKAWRVAKRRGGVPAGKRRKTKKTKAKAKAKAAGAKVAAKVGAGGQQTIATMILSLGFAQRRQVVA